MVKDSKIKANKKIHNIRGNQQCPAVDGATPVYFPHPTDCGKFYECSNGEKLEQECALGLHFNPNKNVCDWPLVAGCAQL